VSENNENIPLDEMMSNLKKGADQKRAIKIEGGERVVRADGSEAIKVKTKKRRTNQPKSKVKVKSIKRKVIFVTSLIGVALLSVILFTVLLGYYNGSKFKAKVSDSIAVFSDAEVELGKLDVSAKSGKLSHLDLQWAKSNSLLGSLNFKQIVASYGIVAFVGGDSGDSSISIDEGTLDLRLLDSKPNLKMGVDTPLDLKFALCECDNFNINFGASSLWSFKNGVVSYRSDQDVTNQFNIGGGEFTVPYLGVFKVNNGILSCSGQGIEVYLDLRATEHSGRVSIDGVSGYNKGGLVHLKTEIKDYPLREWIDPKTRRFFNGKVRSGEGEIKTTVGSVKAFETKTDFIMRLAQINDFEFISTIANKIDDEYYTSPVFTDESKITVDANSDYIRFSNIDLRQNGQFRIKGNVKISAANEITGNVQVGLPVTVISNKKIDGLQKIFKDNDGEYIWADVVMGGDLSYPSDDLDEQFERVLGGESKPKPLSPEDRFKELTQ